MYLRMFYSMPISAYEHIHDSVNLEAGIFIAFKISQFDRTPIEHTLRILNCFEFSVFSIYDPI